MADSYIPYAAPSATNGRLDAESMDIGGLTVLRERIQLAGTASAQVAAVLNSDPTTGLYGGVVRPIMPADPFGYNNDAAATLGATGSLSAKLRAISRDLVLPAALLGGRLDVNNGAWMGSTTPTVGQKTMAASIPVVLSSDHSNVPVNMATALSNLIDSISVTGKRATYYCGGNLTPYTTAATVVELIGSGTKTVRVRRIIINLKATSVGNYPISVSKNSVPASGGTSSTPAIIPSSSANAAATAVVKQYSAVPTAPTSLGNIRGGNLQITDSDTPTFIGQYIWTFGDMDTQAAELLGTGESLSITCNGVAVPTGASLDYVLEWTEE